MKIDQAVIEALESHIERLEEYLESLKDDYYPYPWQVRQEIPILKDFVEKAKAGQVRCDDEWAW